METSARSDTPQRFLAPQVFLVDSRLALAVLNHLRYLSLNRVFGTSREQANVLTVVLLLGAADGAYEIARRISGMHLDAFDAGLGTIAVREAALGVAGPGARAIPGFGTLVGFALLGGLAAPGLRRMAKRTRAAERRVRRARISRYAAERDRLRANTA